MTDLASRLAGLRAPAPPNLMPRVLERVRLADHYLTHPSPLGPVFVAFSRRGITLVDLAGDPEEFTRRYAARLGRPVLPVAEAPSRLAGALARALSRGETGRVPLDLAGLSPFQRAVLHQAAAIPPGEVRPYGWVAAEVGRPGAGRAVGHALAANPVPLVVPCHRVVRADGRLGRYSLGAEENKRALLAAEGCPLEDQQRLAARGVRFLASAATRVFCYPTCRHARRISPRNRVELRDARHARQAGFRPCRDCRPSSP